MVSCLRAGAKQEGWPWMPGQAVSGRYEAGALWKSALPDFQVNSWQEVRGLEDNYPGVKRELCAKAPPP